MRVRPRVTRILAVATQAGNAAAPEWPRLRRWRRCSGGRGGDRLDVCVWGVQSWVAPDWTCVWGADVTPVLPTYLSSWVGPAPRLGGWVPVTGTGAHGSSRLDTPRLRWPWGAHRQLCVWVWAELVCRPSARWEWPYSVQERGVQNQGPVSSSPGSTLDCP